MAGAPLSLEWPGEEPYASNWLFGRGDRLGRLMLGLDEGLLSLTLSNLLYMENPYSHTKFQ